MVLDPLATPLMARRMGCAESLEELLFALVMLGDDRAVAATYVLGEPVSPRITPRSASRTSARRGTC